MVRKASGEFIVCPNGLETVFVEDAISFADTEVVLVFGDFGELLWKA